jgi:hypothetical protein
MSTQLELKEKNACGHPDMERNMFFSPNMSCLMH